MNEIEGEFQIHFSLSLPLSFAQSLCSLLSPLIGWFNWIYIGNDMSTISICSCQIGLFVRLLRFWKLLFYYIFMSFNIYIVARVCVLVSLFERLKTIPPIKWLEHQTEKTRMWQLVLLLTNLFVQIHLQLRTKMNLSKE